jgi:hypothetical protein
MKIKAVEVKSRMGKPKVDPATGVVNLSVEVPGSPLQVEQAESMQEAIQIAGSEEKAVAVFNEQWATNKGNELRSKFNTKPSDTKLRNEARNRVQANISLLQEIVTAAASGGDPTNIAIEKAIDREVEVIKAEMLQKGVSGTTEPEEA